jgi:hypothetical protein
VDALEVMARRLRFPAEQEVADRLQLEQQLLEPELVGLVDDDEQHLVVSGGIRLEGL